MMEITKEKILMKIKLVQHPKIIRKILLFRKLNFRFAVKTVQVYREREKYSSGNEFFIALLFDERKMFWEHPIW